MFRGLGFRRNSISITDKRWNCFPQRHFNARAYVLGHIVLGHEGRDFQIIPALHSSALSDFFLF